MAGLGAITGIVSDPSGARIAGTEVLVENEARGIRRPLTTSGDGLFSALSLQPASGYTVTVNAPGFQPYKVSNIDVQVGRVIDLRVDLQVATAGTQVEITADQVQLETTQTGVNQVVTEEQITQLPINGRRVDQFVLLSPGVTNDGQFGLLSFRGIPGGNAFLTDGNDTTNQYYNENAGRTRITTQISADAVKEFQVVSSGYSAEFGRAAGGVINTVTQSGSNALHGNAYFFFRNQDFNARDRYATFTPEEQRIQSGGSLGGRIVRDKLFYFGNFEITRRDFPLVSSLNDPRFFNSGGQLIAPCTASAAQCQAATDFVSRFNNTISREANSELLFGKLDWRPNDVHSVSASFNYLRWISPNGIQTGAVLNNAAGYGSNGLSTVRTRYGRLALTSTVSPVALNEFRFGWFKDRLADGLTDLLPPNGVLSSLSVGGVGNLGTANYLPRVQPSEDRFQFADTFSYTAGKHLLKLGLDLAQTRDVQDQLNNGRGSYTYANFTNFALDLTGNTGGAKNWQSYQQAFGNPLSEVWIADYNFFVNDQWRVTQALTLNLGVRYEFANFTQPAASNPAYPLTSRIPEPDKNFAPRVGIAYAFNQNRTVFRGGYGISYARYPGALVTSLNIQNVQQQSINLQGNVASTLASGPVFPNALPSLGGLPAAGATSVLFAGEDLRTPYTQQADIGIEHSLGSYASLVVSYLWSRGVQFITTRDLNIGALGPNATYQVRDALGTALGSFSTPTYLLSNRVDPRYQRVNQLENGGRVNYDGLAVQLRNRTLRFGPITSEGTLSYTWSHTIDTGLGTGGDNLFFNGGPNTLFNGDYSQERGSSSLDQRHRLTIGQVVGFGISNPSQSKLLQTALANWQLSLLYTYGTPQFVTPTVFVSGSAFPGAAYTGSLNGFQGNSRLPFLPRNFLELDTVNRLDARISKVVPMGESRRLLLFFEGFNIFNSQYDTSIRNQWQFSNGVIAPQAGYLEGTASAGFPDGTNARRAQVGARFEF